MDLAIFDLLHFLKNFFVVVVEARSHAYQSIFEIHFVARDDCELLLLLPLTSQMLRLQMCTIIPGIDSAEASFEFDMQPSLLRIFVCMFMEH